MCVQAHVHMLNVESKCRGCPATTLGLNLSVLGNRSDSKGSFPPYLQKIAIFTKSRESYILLLEESDFPMLSVFVSSFFPQCFDIGLENKWLAVMLTYIGFLCDSFFIRLGGIPVGVVAVETRTVELSTPADPANLDSEAKVEHLESPVHLCLELCVPSAETVEILQALQTTSFRGKGSQQPWVISDQHMLTFKVTLNGLQAKFCLKNQISLCIVLLMLETVDLCRGCGLTERQLTQCPKALWSQMLWSHRWRSYY